MKTILLFFVLLNGHFLAAQSMQDSVDFTRKNIQNKRWRYAAASVYVGGLTALSWSWYGNSMQKRFHFFNDNSQWQSLDKLGHALTAHHLSKLVYPHLKEKPYKALLAAGIGALAMLPIEVLDGFSPDYGASWGDLAANTGGAALFFLQAHWLKKDYFYYKFSYWPSIWAAKRPQVLGASHIERLIKDYNAQTYWFSADLYLLSHQKWKALKLFNLGLGYGADQMLYGNPEQNLAAGFMAQNQFYIGLDWNFSRLKPRSKFLRFLIRASGLIKLPAPALRYQENTWQMVIL